MTSHPVDYGIPTNGLAAACNFGTRPTFHLKFYEMCVRNEKHYNI